MKVYKIRAKTSTTDPDTVKLDDGEIYQSDNGVIYVVAESIADATSWIGDAVLSVDLIGKCEIK